MDCSPPGSSVFGISQARRLEWVAISFSRGSSQLKASTHISSLAGGCFTTEPPGKPKSLLNLVPHAGSRQDEGNRGVASLEPLTSRAPPAPPSTRRGRQKQQPRQGRWAARATRLGHQEVLESTPSPLLQPECSTIIWPER